MSGSSSQQSSIAEGQRLEILNYHNLLDSPTEERFDRITETAANLFKSPYCTIGLVDVNRVWYKSRFGLHYKQVPRIGSFEDYVITTQNHIFTQNAKQDSRFMKNQLVINEPHIIFCVSVPFYADNNTPIGALSLLSPDPIEFSVEDLKNFKALSKWVETEFKLDSQIVRGSTSSDLSQTRERLNVRNIELAQTRAHQVSMLKNIGDGVIGVDDSGLIIFANEAAFEMLGYSSDDLMGKQYLHTIHMVDEQGEELPINKRPIRNAIFNQERYVNQKNYYIKKDGTKLPVAVTASSVILQGKTIGGVVVFRDITKEREIDRMKTEFISLASHQLRTPLSAMKWFAELLLEGDSGELSTEQRQMIENIYQSNERMIELVNSLLNISRIESGRIIIDPKPTNLKNLVEEVCVELDQKLKNKNLSFVLNAHPELPQISIDPKLIRHVYMNLLTNAIKYTPEGGEILVLISKKDDKIISQISDNGYGIPKEQQDKVFQKFFRADNIVKVETDGSGLGLYLIKAIIDSSGGDIWFKSEENKGTTFWFSLPLSGTKPKKGEVVIDA